MSILVVGSAGLVGRRTVRHLTHAGVDVLAADLRLPAADDGEDPTTLVLDVGDLAQVVAAVTEHRPAAIVHLAAAPGLTAHAQRDPLGGARANLDSALHVLEAARLAGVSRVVLASSASVYLGSVDASTVRTTEDQPLHPPTSVYAATKLGAELLASAYARGHDVETTCLRLPRVVGPRRTPRTPHEVAFARLAVAASTVVPVEIERFTAGEELIHPADAATALAAAALRPEPPSAVLNVVGTDVVTVEDVVAMFSELAGGVEVTIRPLDADYPYRDPIPAMDGTRAAQELGYQPSHDLRAIVRDHLEAVRAGAARAVGPAPRQ